MTRLSNVPRRPVLLIILDGLGISPRKSNNGVAEAATPVLDRLFSQYPFAALQASGPAVGLPDGQMGNSEVGHLTLGAGAVIRQDLVKINDAIDSGEFFTNGSLLAAIRSAVDAGRPVHLFGLVSDGGVHSQMTHLLALLRLCREQGAKPLLHMITDGRDTAPRSALGFLAKIGPALSEAGGAIATVMGRYYAMDRDQRWDRTERAWRAIVLRRGARAESAHSAIVAGYERGEGDEFIRPTVLPAAQALRDGDSLICFNFRKDRPRQIVAALSAAEFSGFDRGSWPRVKVTGMMRYDPAVNMAYAFDAEEPKVTLSRVVSDACIKQFHCAETEKYAHVTYFFNGGRHEPLLGETQLLVPSPTVATYDLKPQMSAVRITDSVLNALRSKKFGFVVVNYANGDMVGHTAVRDAVIQAVETLDGELGRLVPEAVQLGYSVVVTADHGNCEELVDSISGAPHTQHTSNPVPCVVVDECYWQLSCVGGLSGVAPTVLQLMGLPQPAAMTGRSLLLRQLGPTHVPSGVLGAA